MERVLILQVYLLCSNRPNFPEAVKSLQALYDHMNCNYCAVLVWNDLASIILVKTGEKWKKASVFPV